MTRLYYVTKPVQYLYRGHYERGFTKLRWRCENCGVRYSNLRFTDDTAFTCSSKSELLKLLKQLKEISKRIGLLLNTKKAKIMIVDSKRVDVEFMLEEKIKEVDNFVYLGSAIDTSCKSSKELRKRLALAKSTVQSMLNTWKSRGVSLS